MKIISKVEKVKDVESIAKLMIFFAIYWFINLGVHEMGHYYSASLLGYRASVHFALTHAWTNIQFTFGTADGLMIGLSGGMFAFVIWLVLSWLTTSYLRDISLGFFCVHNLIYGVFEGLWAYGWVEFKALQIVPVIIASMVFIWAIYMNPDFHFFGRKS